MISLTNTEASASAGVSSVATSGVIAEISSDFAAPRAIIAPPPPIGSQVVHEAAGGIRVRIEEVSAWSNSREREFTRLAALKAMKKASRDELAEFARLQAIRRRTKNPQSAQERVFQYQRREMEGKLLAELQRYVAFLETPRR